MTLLLDTHYLLWAAIQPEKLRSWEASLLRNTTHDVLVSAASLYEIGIKVRAGKLPEATDFDRNLIGNVRALRFTLLPITPEVMLRAAHFPSLHKDPFDRIISAQAIDLDIPILTADTKLSDLGARRLTATNPQ